MIFSIILLDLSFTYNGAKAQEIILDKGRYLFQCWGAQGSEGYLTEIATSFGGKGAYTEGIINLTKQTMFYIYVGGKAKTPNANEIISGYQNRGYGGFNGGGDGGHNLGQIYYVFSGGGGGATDIRTSTSSDSRIMVAAGGSGAAGDNDGAPGGNQTGLYWIAKNKLAVSELTTQNKGGKNGLGENGGPNWETPGSGGGGGYYGGVAANILDESYDEHYKVIAHSGSSFIDPNYFTSPLYVVGVNNGDGKVSISLLSDCQENCQSCSKDSRICYSCTNYKNLYQGKCLDKCPSGTYDNYPPPETHTIPNNRVCHPCPENCTECNGPYFCSQCKNNYYLTFIFTRSNCSDANSFQYQYGIDHASNIKKCARCEVDKCVDCWSDYKKCDKCADSFYFDGRQCILNTTNSFSITKYFSFSSTFTKSSIFNDSPYLSLLYPFSATYDLSFFGSFVFANSNNEESSNINNEESSNINNEESSNINNEESSNINNEESSNSNNEESSNINNEESSNSNNEESSNINNEESSNSNNEESSNSNNEESSNINNEESSNINNEESSNSNNEESSNINNEESSNSNNEESSNINNEESSNINNEESSNINNEESSNINNEESSNINNEESSNINNEESSNINNEESSNINNEESSNINNEESSNINNEESSNINNEESSNISNEESSNINNEETSNINNEETSNINIGVSSTTTIFKYSTKTDEYSNSFESTQNGYFTKSIIMYLSAISREKSQVFYTNECLKTFETEKSKYSNHPTQIAFSFITNSQQNEKHAAMSDESRMIQSQLFGNPPKSSGKGINATLISSVVAAIVSVLLVCFLIILFVLKKQNKKMKETMEDERGEEILSKSNSASLAKSKATNDDEIDLDFWL